MLLDDLSLQCTVCWQHTPGGVDIDDKTISSILVSLVNSNYERTYSLHLCCNKHIKLTENITAIQNDHTTHDNNFDADQQLRYF